jgi:hypothetical protein
MKKVKEDIGVDEDVHWIYLAEFNPFGRIINASKMLFSFSFLADPLLVLPALPVPVLLIRLFHYQLQGTPMISLDLFNGGSVK